MLRKAYYNNSNNDNSSSNSNSDIYSTSWCDDRIQFPTVCFSDAACHTHTHTFTQPAIELNDSNNNTAIIIWVNFWTLEMEFFPFTAMPKSAHSVLHTIEHKLQLKAWHRLYARGTGSGGDNQANYANTQRSFVLIIIISKNHTSNMVNLIWRHGTTEQTHTQWTHRVRNEKGKQFTGKN